MKKIRMLTYNVQTGKRIDRIIDWLNRLPDTDVICLQEFPKDKIEECMLLLSRIPYGYAFADAFTYRKRTFGELTLYRKDRLKNVHSKIITFDINKLERRVLHSTVPRTCLIIFGTVNRKELALINVHIVALATNASKYIQVKNMIEQLSSISSPHLLLGDFNISSLLGKKRLLLVLKNAGYMTHPIKIATHRVGLLRHQFDYIFAKNSTILEQKVERVKFSDHFPIFASCEF